MLVSYIFLIYVYSMTGTEYENNDSGMKSHWNWQNIVLNCYIRLSLEETHQIPFSNDKDSLEILDIG